MNRRDALAALIVLPAVSRIATATAKPDDVIVVECDQHLTREMSGRIKATIEQVCPARNRFEVATLKSPPGSNSLVSQTSSWLASRLEQCLA